MVGGQRVEEGGEEREKGGMVGRREVGLLHRLYS